MLMCYIKDMKHRRDIINLNLAKIHFYQQLTSGNKSSTGIKDCGVLLPFLM